MSSSEKVWGPWLLMKAKCKLLVPYLHIQMSPKVLGQNNDASKTKRIIIHISSLGMGAKKLWGLCCCCYARNFLADAHCAKFTIESHIYYVLFTRLVARFLLGFCTFLLFFFRLQGPEVLLNP